MSSQEPHHSALPDVNNERDTLQKRDRDVLDVFESTDHRWLKATQLERRCDYSKEEIVWALQRLHREDLIVPFNIESTGGSAWRLPETSEARGESE